MHRIFFMFYYLANPTPSPTKKTMKVLLFVLSTVVAQDYVTDFVSAFTNNVINEDILNIAQECSTQTSTNFLADLLNKGVNATRACAKEVNREHYKVCVDDLVTYANFATDPYTAFAVHPLGASDILTLETCASGLDTDDKIVAAVEVLLKRFLQCDVQQITGEQRTAVLDVFKGDETQHEMARVQLETICDTMQLGGSLHSTFIKFASDALHRFSVLIPKTRRR